MKHLETNIFRSRRKKKRVRIRKEKSSSEAPSGSFASISGYLPSFQEEVPPVPRILTIELFICRESRRHLFRRPPFGKNADLLGFPSFTRKIVATSADVNFPRNHEVARMDFPPKPTAPRAPQEVPLDTTR